MGDAGWRSEPAFIELLPAGRSGTTRGAAGLYVSAPTNVALVSITARRGCDAALAASVAARYGIELPAAPRRAASGAVALIGLGPHRWLFVTEHDAPAVLTAALINELGAHAAVVDVSDAHGVLRLWGPRLREVLAKGVPIDLHPTRFGPDDTATTLIGLIGATIWRSGEAFEIAIPRSLCGSFAAWLKASAGEFGMEVVA